MKAWGYRAWEDRCARGTRERLPKIWINVQRALGRIPIKYVNVLGAQRFGPWGEICTSCTRERLYKRWMNVLSTLGRSLLKDMTLLRDYNFSNSGGKPWSHQSMDLERSDRYAMNAQGF